MIDMFRRDKKQTNMDETDMEEMKYHTKQYSDLKKVLNDAVELLPPVQKMVVMLRDYEGYSYEEIGEIAGLTESQVKVYIFRARAFLKNHIGKIENVL
jgi:RNA polymerase sigma-70 factor (ECF subfamily)